ncbi:MAG: DUF4215 domain-containing protein [Deltaproteobacteria bacterium]|nr:DUF4215 domain-containing protein [Deltaproteobacteria bacterium]
MAIDRVVVRLLALLTLVLALSCGEEPAPDELDAVDADVPAADEEELTTNVGLATEADAYVRSGAPNSPAGTSSLVQVRGGGSTVKNRGLVRFTTSQMQSAVAGQTLIRARLRLRVSSTSGFTGARQLDVHRMTKTWVENRATWNCANDTNTGNTTLNCASADLWTMLATPYPFEATPTGSFTVTYGQTGYVYVDVTADVAAILAGSASNQGWLIKTTSEGTTGTVNFNSRTSTAYQPRLIIDVSGPCGDGIIDPLNGEGCDDGNTAPNDGCSELCDDERCGDGVVQPWEGCDDGNAMPGDGCNWSCELEGCGDFEVNNAGAEQCDDGNTLSNDGCSSACAQERCGDGVVQLWEQCDDGNVMPGDGCNWACELEGCGDFDVNNGGAEQCDDGNTLSNDGCSSACAQERCGDGVVQLWEQCDDGNVMPGDGCNWACELEGCGDFDVNNAGAEQCDDGNTLSNDGCSSVCAQERCGDGVVQLWEQCDDGNVMPGDGCNWACELEGCGDFEVNNAGAEQCDDGNTLSNDGCSSACAQERCGDGVVQLWEQCDDGNIMPGDGCNWACELEGCGDFDVNNAGAEQCDDGNTTGGDGCSATCQSEMCGGVPCAPSGCGDAVVSGGEQCDDGNWESGDGCNNCVLERCGDWSRNNRGTEMCDDGNTVSNDGCSATCQYEACGDGVVQSYEQCDDANWESGDGCNNCVLERCGDWSRNNRGTEMCDDGNTVSNDGCSATCQYEACGDGVVQSYEQCDDANWESGDGCNNCVLERCGDWSRNNRGTEMCDDGNTLSNDGCSATCQYEACGDGVVQSYEQCDDANWESGDGCNNCVLERCGDWSRNNRGMEMCDDGNTVSDDGCSATCQYEACGDGVVQSYEQCDDANWESGDGCNYCVLERCGDWSRNNRGTEMCDDGNTVSNDGCSATCQYEACGDGVVQTNEQCDDADWQTGDGCDNCMVELGPEICGDGLDNDGDTLTDCADPTCATAFTCQ